MNFVVQNTIYFQRTLVQGHQIVRKLSQQKWFGSNKSRCEARLLPSSNFQGNFEDLL